MTIRHWSTPDPLDPNGSFLDYGYFESESSPRDTLGHLKLVQNNHFRNVGKVLYRRRIGNFGGTLRGADWGLQLRDRDLYNRNYEPLYNTAYAKFRGKLYYGKAALGVTAASYRQSAGMIRTRYAQMTAPADRMLAQWATMPTGKKAKSLAGAHLEVIFGWKPLIEDIQASAKSVIQHADTFSHVKGRASTPVKSSAYTPLSGSLSRSHDYDLHMRVTLGATAEVRNLNTWLLERAGLLNPGAVAWDLVPWSFVVNMFVSTGAIVNSITDFAGLQLSDSGVTTSVKGLYWTRYGWKDYYGEDQIYNSTKTRELRPPIRPYFVTRLPDVNWELVAMAASLFTQKFSKLARLVGASRR